MFTNYDLILGHIPNTPGLNECIMYNDAAMVTTCLR